MTKKIKNENAETAIEALSKTEKFFTKHGKKLSTILIVLLLVAIGGYAYYQFVYLPEIEEATEKTAIAESYFILGDYETALEGDGANIGFNQIIKQYGDKAPKAIYFYAGLCELNLQNWEQAIKNLEKYKGQDPILKAAAIAAIGHAQVGLENYEAALASFEKAADVADNNFVANYLFNAGVVAEELGQNDKALNLYKKIKDLYPQSPEAFEIDKYIGRVENK